MIVVGGCYRELCESPSWDALLGSGGRAAIVLAGLGSRTSLATYRPRGLHHDLYSFEVHGVSVTAQPSTTEVAFSYLHPLSQPIVVPYAIPRERPLVVEGNSILRFGMKEGDAVVTAKHAIYDPQSAQAELFAANGSKAENLAIVLNEFELRQLGQFEDTGLAAERVMEWSGADAVVAKCGVRGAWVFVPNETPQWVPAFRSSSVFKIGTGDVFSAVFAYHWAECDTRPVEAATLASRSVAAYATSASLPLRNSDTARLTPVGDAQEAVVVVGGAATLADCWLCEEAVSRLIELGVSARKASVDALPSAGSLLVLADGLAEANSVILAALAAGLFVVVFRQRTILPVASGASVQLTDDFATALYWVGWGKV